jgi:hypothetical protein
MNAHPDSNTQLPSLWLRLARWVVIGFAVFTFTAAMTGAALFPGYAARRPSDFTPNDFWTFEQTQAGLAQLGWPPTTVVWFELARGLILTFGAGAVGLLILWRKSDDWFGLYLTFVFLDTAVGTGPMLLPLADMIPVVRVLHDLLGSASWQFFFIVFYFFPDGRTVPRWTRWLALAWGGFIVLNWISPGLVGTPFAIPLSFGLVFSALGSQIYRYFRRADPIQRQQTKWVMFVVVIIIAVLALIAPRAFDPPTGPDFGTALFISLVNLSIFSGVFLLFPIAIVIAILRYRLWDIDILIRRTLQYSVVSALLALVYFGGVVVLQRIFTSLTGQGQNQLVTVLSTLAIAALFTPVRRRVQDVIDRRFYRKKYDAAKVIAEFGATCRDETDLDKLTARLVEVVQETMQPESVSLWLKDSNAKPPLSHRDASRSAAEGTPRRREAGE